MRVKTKAPLSSQWVCPQSVKSPFLGQHFLFVSFNQVLECAFLLQFWLFVLWNPQNLNLWVFGVHQFVLDFSHKMYLFEKISVFKYDLKSLDQDFLRTEIFSQKLNHSIQIFFCLVILRAVDRFQGVYRLFENSLDLFEHSDHFILIVFKLLLRKNDSFHCQVSC